MEFSEDDYKKWSTTELIVETWDISPHIAGWIGFTYRQLHYETGLHSREIFEKIPIKKLCIAYEGFYTIDEDMSAEILKENFIDR